MPIRNITLLLATAALLGSATFPSRAAEPMRFRAVTVDLPADARTFPGSPEAEAINANCLACHSAGMVLTQPRLSRAEWQAEVDKMIHTYKAPVDPADVAAIVDYLAALNPGP